MTHSVGKHSKGGTEDMKLKSVAAEMEGSKYEAAESGARKYSIDNLARSPSRGTEMGSR
jgi:hypothetical protein